ncbi:hypothetical protein C0995_003841 [Termitomyces sp. Mi166|nr:hypothetical protein C0995_003841 [Termitomyces sp. Mi166\
MEYSPSTSKPDILSTIFADLQPRKRLRYRIPFEVAMSHVCRRWRDVAFASPLLWKNIDVYSSESFDAVSSYLKRSHNCPVNIRIDIWQSDRNLDPHDGAISIMPIVDLLNEHATRWKTLLVFAYYRTTTNAILSRIKDLAAPLLERVHVVDDNMQTDLAHVIPFQQTFPTNPLFLLGGAPKLAVLHSNNLEQFPPLANVTTLHLRTSQSFFSSLDIDTHVFLDLATVCPSLSTLSIHSKYVGRWTVNDVAMPNLRSLWFSNSDTLAAKFLTTVRLPNLESLWLDCPHYQAINMIYDHHPRPSFLSLKYLTLQSFDYYASTKFSQVFPTIEALHLAYCNSFHITFLKQTLVEDRWQNLRTLAFRTTRETYAVKFSNILNELVIERHVGGRPILRVLMDSDLLTALTTANSVRTYTSLEELRADNYNDPWWILSHTNEERWV